MDILEDKKWSEWGKFPDPRKEEYLYAPFGCGVYQIRNKNEYILFGRGKNCAFRMSSLLPKPLGQGTRKNDEKSIYVFKNNDSLEYRTIAFNSEYEVINFEKNLNN